MCITWAREPDAKKFKPYKVEWLGWNAPKRPFKQSEPAEKVDAVAPEPATPTTRSRTDCKRYTPAEMDLPVGKGYDVLSDQVVERIRRYFIEALPPSIEDIMPQEEINRLLRGEETDLRVPLEPA